VGGPLCYGAAFWHSFQKVQQDAAVLGISVAHKVEAERSNAAFFAGRASAATGANLPGMALANAASALVRRGLTNPNSGVPARNAGALRLGGQVGSVVMGPEKWAQYIKTSAKAMTQGDKPLTATQTQELARARISCEREGWVFHHAALSVSRWEMTDEITYTLPGHTQANPRLYKESFQVAVSEAYHAHWKQFSALSNKNQKDQDAGKQLSRSRRKP